MRQQLLIIKTGNKRTGFVMAAVAALALAFAPGIAEAGGYKGKHHGKHYGKRYKHNNGAVIVLGALGVLGWALHSGNYSYGYPQVSYSRRYYRRYKRRHHRYRHAYGYEDSCSPVSKIGYWHGHKAKIGGTACVDACGNFHVLKGSRYLIRYLY